MSLTLTRQRYVTFYRVILNFSLTARGLMLNRGSTAVPQAHSQPPSQKHRIIQTQTNYGLLQDVVPDQTELH